MGDRKMKVLITTSGLGNRLGNITKYTNKSLVRLGKLASISHIINSYPKDAEFFITIGHYGSHVKQYIKLAHSEIKVTFINIDKYEGIGSSLLYSMNCAKPYLNSEFIFHACDSILPSTLYFEDGNVCLSTKKEDNSQYRTHVIEDNKIKLIEEKGSLIHKNAHIGVIKIKDYDLFWKFADDILINYPTDSSLSDCHVINKMIESGCTFKSQNVNNWFDIGNSKSLSDTKRVFEETFNFKILDKEEENIFIFPSFVIKFFYDSNITKNRVERLRYLKNYGPKLLESTENYYKYEFVEGELSSHNNNAELFYDLLKDLSSNFWTFIEENDSFYQKTKQFYFDKTKDRVNLFYKQRGTTYNDITINGVKIDTLDSLLSKIPTELLCTNKKYHFHGDFILDNLIIQNNKFKFLDWRQDFCGDVNGGDLYYDLAKMNHSLYFDHSLILNNNYNIIENNKDINIELLCKLSSINKREKFNKFILKNNLNIKKINILTAIIWLNMSPLHEYPLSKFLYYLGMYTLQKNVNEL